MRYELVQFGNVKGDDNCYNKYFVEIHSQETALTDLCILGNIFLSELQETSDGREN